MGQTQHVWAHRGIPAQTAYVCSCCAHAVLRVREQWLHCALRTVQFVTPAQHRTAFAAGHVVKQATDRPARPRTWPASHPSNQRSELKKSKRPRRAQVANKAAKLPSKSANKHERPRPLGRPNNPSTRQRQRTHQASTRARTG
eukprot:6598430-Alexandrium_andersonii.AAC.1